MNAAGEGERLGETGKNGIDIHTYTHTVMCKIDNLAGRCCITQGAQSGAL